MATKAVGQITVFDYSDGYSVMLTNPSYTFIGDEDSVRGVQSVTTRVVAMQGASQINASVDTSQIIKPTGFTVTSNGATPSPTLTIQANQSVTDAGVLTIPVTVATGVTVSLQWSYSIAFTGGKGDTGDAGRGVTGTTVQYAPGTLPTTPPSSGWDDTVPSVDEGKYLWVKTVFTYSSGDPVTTYSVAKQGEKGSTGNGISSTVVEYAESTSGVTPPATIASWGSDIPNVAQGNYLWTRTTTNYTGSNPTVSYSVARIGMDGEPATTYSLIVSHAAIIKSASGTFSPTSITLTAKSQTGTGAFANYSGRFKIEVHNGSSWSTKYTSSSNENTKSYTIPSGTTQVRCSLYLAGGTTTLLDQQTVPVVSDGTSVTITSKSVKYQKGTSGTTAPTGAWGDSIPSNIGENEYLWTQTIVNYSDGNSTEAYSVSRNAANGFSPTVSSTTVEYVESTSGTAHPTSGWSTTPPTTMTAGRYMWTKTTVTYDDGNTSESYAVSRNGSNGGDAYTIILDNESHTFAGGTSAAIAGTATVNVYAYKGTTAIAPTVTKANISGLPTGMTAQSVTNDSSNNKTTIVFAVTTSMTTRSGLVTIPVVADGKTFNKEFSYALALQGTKGDKGDTGKSLTGITEYYARNNSTTAPADSAFNTSVLTPTASEKYVWNYEQLSWNDNGTTSTTKTTKHIIAVYGDKGETGDKGNTGKSLTNVTEYYAVNNSTTAPADSSFSTTVAAPTSSNKYLWNYELLTWDDNGTTSTTKTDKHIAAVYGDKGDKGDTGKALTGITEYYALNNSTTAPADSSFSTTVKTPTASNKYVWNYEQLSWNDNGTTSTTKTTKHIVAVYGDKGDQGDKGNTGKALTGITEYYAINNSTTAPADSAFGTSVKAPTSSNKYLWNYELLAWNDNGTTSTTKTDKHIAAVYGDKGDKGDKGDTGVSISSVTNYYLATSASSGVTTSTSGWTTTVQTMDSTKQYLWNYEVIKGSNNSTLNTTTPVIIGRYGQNGGKGDTGRGITSIAEHYQVSSSNTTAPSSWSDTMVNTTATNKYLWNYETVTYTDGTTEDSTKRVIGTHGEKGDTGASIASVTNYYLASASSSGVTTSTSGWTTNPTASAATMTSTKQYLWNYEVIKDSNNTTITTTSPVIIGRYGQNGGTGSAGKGITGITEYYLATSASSGVTTSTSGWTTAVQSTTATNKYLWNYEVISYTSGNPYTSDPRIIGTYGDKGDKGVGVTSITKTGTSGTVDTYTIKYTDNTSTTFTVTNGTNGTNGTSAEWFCGTALTHTSGTATAAISGAKVGDMYLNTATSNVYKCTAKNVWTYAGNISEGVIDNIEIGGRNLVKNSDIACSSSGAAYTKTVSGGNVTRIIPEGTTVTISVRVDADNVVWNTSYNYSRIGCEFNVSKTGGGTQYIGVWAGKSESQYANIVKSFTGSFHGRVSRTFVLQGEVPLDNVVNLYVQGVTSGTASSSRVQLEIGNKATDWTPAPEDVAADIESVQANLVPNLTPWFDRPLTDVYNSTTNPNGYWNSNTLTSALTQLPDGWAHVDVTNSGTSNALLMRAVGRAVNGIVTGGNYTCLVEFRNVVNAAGIDDFYTQQADYGVQFWGDGSYDGFNISASLIVDGAKIYKPMKCVTGPTKSDTLNWLMSIASYIKPSQTVSYDFRVSLYEGTYTGPYKPYVDQDLRADVDDAKDAANTAQATADRKKQTFISTPAPPYYEGDAYFKTESGESGSAQWYVCTNTRLTAYGTGESWEDDFEQTSYALEATLQNTKAELLEEDKKIKASVEEQKKYTDGKVTPLETRTSTLEQTTDNLTIDFNREISGLKERTESNENDLSSYQKVFAFTENGLQISEQRDKVQTPSVLQIDNGRISFIVDGQESSYWSGENSMFYVGDIVVGLNKKAQFGNFAWIPRSNGNLSFRWVGSAEDNN